MGQRMLMGFALYTEPTVALPPTHDHNTIQMQPGTRLHRLLRLPHGWRLWIATRDFIYGTYIELFDDGRGITLTSRADEGDEFYCWRPSDEELRRRR